MHEPMRAPGGVDAGDQEQPQRADHVLRGQRLALELDADEVADQIVAGLLQALLHVAARNTACISPAASHGDGDVGDAVLQDHLDPFAIEVAVGSRAGPACGR